MIKQYVDGLKNRSYTLRFSILTIFVTLFLLTTIVLLAFTYFRFVHSIHAFSFKLMQDASHLAYHEVALELDHAEIESKSTAELISEHILHDKDANQIKQYLTSLMENNESLFKSVQSIIWGNVDGSFVFVSKNNNFIDTDVIDRSHKPYTRQITTHDVQTHSPKTVLSSDFSFDPKTRPWYTAAENNGTTSWVNVYPYKLTGYLGITVATPAYDSITKQLLGVIGVDIRLDYLRNILESIALPANASLFIITGNGQLIAYPNIEQYQHKSLINVHSLKQFPWVIQAFDYFKKTGELNFKFKYNHILYLATFKPVYKFQSAAWYIGVVIPESDFIGALYHTQIMTMLLSCIFLIIGILLVSSLVSRIVKPLKKITKEIEDIREFKLELSEPITSRIKEINYISNALVAMKSGLRSFKKYVPAALVRQLIETGEDLRIGGTKRSLVILFSDIKNFTAISERMDPDDLMLQICEYFDELSKIIVEHQGTIDKYIGDSIMAFWGAPVQVDDACLLAAKAALACMQRTDELNIKWYSQGKPQFVTRFGIHLGTAIVGNVGSTERLNYTAIGDSINVANRLENINKVYHTKVVVSDRVYEEINDKFALRLVDRITLRGKEECHFIYELLSDDKNKLSFNIDAYNMLFMQAYAEYRKQNWQSAIKYFNECKNIYPTNHLAQIFIDRCHYFITNPPPKNWDGIWDMRENGS